MNDNIKILDCTLRDGGQGLEDLNNNGIHTEYFTENDKEEIISQLEKSEIEIIELGCMAESGGNKERFSIYRDIQCLSRYIPNKRNKRKMYVGLYTGPDTDISKIPEHTSELIDGVRVIIRYSELKKSLVYCTALAKKGYKVFIQPMLTMRYSVDELNRLIYSANEMGAYAMYFVDSFGYMNCNDIDQLYYIYTENLDPEISIGFHAHNNIESAFENAKYFIEKHDGRKKIVDSCVMGMGQGAGNLQTEIIMNYMNDNYMKNYDFECILSICDILEKFRLHDMETWGYSPVRLVPAIHKTAYKYAVTMKLQYGMSLVEINRILKNIPENIRHRYTADNLKQLLQLSKEMEEKNGSSSVYSRTIN